MQKRSSLEISRLVLPLPSPLCMIYRSVSMSKLINFYWPIPLLVADYYKSRKLKFLGKENVSVKWHDKCFSMNFKGFKNFFARKRHQQQTQGQELDRAFFNSSFDAEFNPTSKISKSWLYLQIYIEAAAATFFPRKLSKCCDSCNLLSLGTPSRIVLISRLVTHGNLSPSTWTSLVCALMSAFR